jgi:Sulfotransferase family
MRGHARWPDFFIVGHHKSGTTALYKMLRTHPQVFMPDLKEPRFMASDLRPRELRERHERNPQTAEEYLALFEQAASDQKVGEASATYLFSQTAAAHIAERRPNARIIAILREPTSFLRSLHNQYLEINYEDVADLRAAMELEPARREGRRLPRYSLLPQLLQYSQQVHYVEQLGRYRANFPSEQILVLIYDDFRNDNQATIGRVQDFLEVERRQLAPLEANVTTSTIRAPQTDTFLTALSIGRRGLVRPANAAVKLMTTRRMRRRAIQVLRQRVVVGEPEPLDPEFAAELRRRFKPEVAAISEQLGRDLVSLWGYEGVD